MSEKLNLTEKQLGSMQMMVEITGHQIFFFLVFSTTPISTVPTFQFIPRQEESLPEIPKSIDKHEIN